MDSRQTKIANGDKVLATNYWQFFYLLKYDEFRENFDIKINAY